MKNKKIFSALFALIIVCVMLFGALSLTAYAAPDGGEGGDEPVAADDPVDTPDPYEPGQGGELEPDPVPDDPVEPVEPVDPVDVPTEAPDDNGEGDDTYEPTEDFGDTTYTEPEYLDELPTAVTGEVIQATAVVIPRAEVTDASLLSGIIMWLCVAVGIAVVVGVMVSKRTHRRGV